MFWLLILSYWLHLLATAVWVAVILVMALSAVPAFRQSTLVDNQWLALQKKLLPWASLSLVLLLITGFVQMTNDANYSGFLAFDSTWAWAMLIKHFLFLVVLAVAAYWQFVYFPAVERTAVLAAQKPHLAQSEQAKLARRERQLLWLNVACAVAILFCTAVLTAI
jgi:uncharacterized membrane protein